MRLRTREQKYNTTINKANSLKYRGPSFIAGTQKTNFPIFWIIFVIFFIFILLALFHIPLIWNIIISPILGFLPFIGYFIFSQMKMQKKFYYAIEGFEKIIAGNFFRDAQLERIIYSSNKDEDIYEKNTPNYNIQFGEIYNEEGSGKHRRVVDNFWLWKIIFPNKDVSENSFLFEKKLNPKEDFIHKSVIGIFLLFGFFISLLWGFIGVCIYLSIIAGAGIYDYKRKQEYIDFKENFRVKIKIGSEYGMQTFLKNIPEDIEQLLENIAQFYEKNNLTSHYIVYGKENFIYIKDSSEKKSFFKELKHYFLRKDIPYDENNFSKKVNVIEDFAKEISISKNNII